jgi:hypothetical protein
MANVINNYISGFTCAILFVLYIPTLLRVIFGSKYKSVITIVSLLLANNYFSLWLNQVFFIQLQSGDLSKTAIWGFSITFGAIYLLLLVPHFLLAWIYREMSIDIPLSLNQLEPDEAQQKKDESTYKVLLTLNIAFPVA